MAVAVEVAPLGTMTIGVVELEVDEASEEEVDEAELVVDVVGALEPELLVVEEMLCGRLSPPEVEVVLVVASASADTALDALVEDAVLELDAALELLELEEASVMDCGSSSDVCWRAFNS